MKLEIILCLVVSFKKILNQTNMENLQLAPKRLPLIIILIGTTLLAFPAAFGTLALFESSSSSGPGMNDWAGQTLFCISVGGFGLFAGYILTAIFNRHYSIFWLSSTLYNFGLSCCYGYSLLAELTGSPIHLIDNLFNAWKNPVFLILFWTIFVTIASGYYFKFSVSPKKLNFD